MNKLPTTISVIGEHIVTSPTSHIIIGDVHGCYKSLQALLAKLPHANVKLVGDLCDRGPRSAQVYQWAITNNIPCVMGNHEHMLLLAHIAHIGSEQNPDDEQKKAKAIEYLSLWMHNGGRECLESYDPGDVKKWHECIPKAHMQWIASLPTYLLYPFDSLLISHTGHAYGATDLADALWARGYQFPKDNYYRIFGHSVTKEPIITETYANIDTGSFKTTGKITAIEYPSMRTWSQDNID